MFVYRTLFPIAMLVSQKVPQTVVTLIKVPSSPQQVWFLPHRSSVLNIKLDSYLHEFRTTCHLIMLFDVLCVLFFLGKGLHKMSWTGCYIQQRGTCQNSDPFLSRTGLAAYRTNSIQKHFISWSYFCRSTSKKKTTNHFKSISPYPKILIFTSISDLIYLWLTIIPTTSSPKTRQTPTIIINGSLIIRRSLGVRQASILVDICFGLVFCGTLTSTYIATTDWEKAPKDFRQPLVVEQMGGWVVGVVLGRGVWFPNRGWAAKTGCFLLVVWEMWEFLSGLDSCTILYRCFWREVEWLSDSEQTCF